MLNTATIPFWNQLGLVVKRGEKAVGFDASGAPLFNRDQTKDQPWRPREHFRRQRDSEPDYDNSQQDWELM